MSEDGIDQRPLGVFERLELGRICTALKAWAGHHPALFGVAEAAVGVALITAGMQYGTITLGADLVLTTGGKVGAAAGGTAGAVAAYAIGGIGVAALGGAIAVPAIVLGVFGGTVGSLTGYAVGDIVERVVNPATMLDRCAPGAMLVLGVSLVVDGLRRILGDGRAAAAAVAISDGVLQLPRLAVNATLATLDELNRLLADFRASPAAAATNVVAIAGLTAVAYSVTPVTVLGSSTLGAIGVGLGLVSAPIWPALAVGGAATVVCLAARKYLRREAHGPANHGGDQ